MKFEFMIQGDPAQKLQRIKALAAQKSVTIIGDLRGGTFLGGISILGMGIKGNYVISDDKIIVDVIEKPNSYSWQKVESEFRSFIEE